MSPLKASTAGTPYDWEPCRLDQAGNTGGRGRWEAHAEVGPQGAHRGLDLVVRHKGTQNAEHLPEAHLSHAHRVVDIKGRIFWS